MLRLGDCVELSDKNIIYFGRIVGKASKNDCFIVQCGNELKIAHIKDLRLRKTGK